MFSVWAVCIASQEDEILWSQSRDRVPRWELVFGVKESEQRPFGRAAGAEKVPLGDVVTFSCEENTF